MTLTATPTGTLRLPGAPPGQTPGNGAAAPAPAAGPGVLTARAIKVVVVLEPAAVLAALGAIRDVGGRLTLQIAVDGRRLRVNLNAKSARKAAATIREHGADAVAAIIQGKLVGDEIAEAGLVVQPKVKPAAATEATGGKHAA